jgi:hypothetical protein
MFRLFKLPNGNRYIKNIETGVCYIGFYDEDTIEDTCNQMNGFDTNEILIL